MHEVYGNVGLWSLALATLMAGCARGGADGAFAAAPLSVADDASAPSEGSSGGGSGADVTSVLPASSIDTVQMSPPSFAHASDGGDTATDAGSGAAEPEASDGAHAAMDAGSGAAEPDASDRAHTATDAGSGAGEPDASDGAHTATDAASAPAAPGAIEGGTLVYEAYLGDLLITEVMFAPSGAKPQSEWFEVYNTAASPTLLSGLAIVDGSKRTHVVASQPLVVAPASAFVLFVRDLASARANGLPRAAIVYEYGAGLSTGDGIHLDDGPTGAVSLWNGDVELASVPYGSWGLVALSQSLELGRLQLVGSDTGPVWCFGQHPWAVAADFGTPGTANDCP